MRGQCAAVSHLSDVDSMMPWRGVRRGGGLPAGVVPEARAHIFIMKIVHKAQQTIENINEYKNTQLYKPIQYTHINNATYLLTRNAADEHVNLISIKIKRICSTTNKQEFQ